MLNVPNAITLLRVALVPVIAMLLLRGRHDEALALFIVSALSDLADGVIARRWNLRTRFGAIADPLADKLTMVTVTLLLYWLQVVPVWLAAAVLLRDATIVAGALAYHWQVGRVEMEPSAVSKLNTALEFTSLVAALAVLAGRVPDGLWLQVLFGVTLVTIVWSGAHYVVVWSRKARQARAARAQAGATGLAGRRGD